MTVVNVTPPVISGTARVGQTLHSSTGTWTSDDPLEYRYQWERCDAAGANCVDIANATSSYYQLVYADVGHRLRVEVTATEYATPPPVPVPPTNWTGPITITQGGTYSGSWESTNSTPAVTIATTAPVVLENFRVRNLSGPGTSYIIDAYHGLPGNGVQPTIRNGFVYGGTTYQTSPRWLVAQQIKSLVIENVTIENTRGIELWPCNSVSSPVIQITKVRHNNVVGGASEAGLAYVGNFVQFREITNAAIEISWCEVIDEYNKSEPEDIISIYHTNNVHMFDCFLKHQSNPNNAPGSSQSGVTIDGSDSAAVGCSNNLIERVQIVDAMGIFASLQHAGSGNLISDCRIIADGLLPNGSPKANGFSGLDVNVGSRNAASLNNHAHGNLVGYIGTGGRNDGNLAGCPEGDAGEWANNTHLGHAPTATDEAGEQTFWDAKVSGAGVIIGAVAADPPATPPLDEEFTTTIDPTVWQKKWWWNGDTYWTLQPIEIECFRDAQAFISGGVLNLQAKREDVVDFQGRTHQFSSGMLQTNGIQGVTGTPGPSFTYGLFEARMKSAPGLGMWSTFWLCEAGWPSTCPREIDVVEIVGADPARAHFNFHVNDLGGGGGSSYLHSENLDVNYHTYGCEWRSTYIKWFFDGVEKYQYTGPNIPTTPHYIILGLQIGGAGSWAGTPNPSTFTTATQFVDWVHVSA